MIRSRMRNRLLSLVFAFVALTLIVPSAVTANAMSDDWYPPTCECSFGETTATLTSKSTVVSYSSGKASLKTTYKFSTSAPTELSCTLPVFCRQYELSTYEATLALNGTTLSPSFGYGSKSARFYDSESYAGILALRETLSEAEPTATVHQFIITCTEQTNFSFSLQESDHIMYSFGRHSYTVASRLFDVTITPNQPGSFLVFGSKPIITASDLCNIEYNELTLDEYKAEALEFLTEMTNGYDCTDIINHRMNEFLSSDVRNSEDLFLDSVSLMTYGFLDYSLSLPAGESTIVVEQPMAVGLNSLYSPRVYVGKVYAPAQTAPYSFAAETEEYVVDCTVALVNKAYSGDAAESITIAFCEVAKPDLVNGAAPVQWEPWRIAVVSVCGVVGAACLGLAIFSFIKLHQSKKENKQ